MIIQPGWKKGEPLEATLSREWLVTNGQGGYASGTISGVATRRFHGQLIAALSAPLGRTMMLNHLDERIHVAGTYFPLGTEDVGPHEVTFPQEPWLTGFHLEDGLPVWVFSTEDFVLEKRILMPAGQNTTYVIYRLVQSQQRITVELTPWLRFRPHEGILGGEIAEKYSMTSAKNGWEIRGPEQYPPLRLTLFGSNHGQTIDGRVREHWRYRLEGSQGYESEGALWSPGKLTIEIEPGREGALVASTEDWDVVRALAPREAANAEQQRRAALLRRADRDTRSPFGSQLVLAADQFIITPLTRPGDVARARAAGEDPRTVIAGYHWFTDWGRDTMISLEGLTLTTGRYREAASILRSFSVHIRDGLIPNLFPEGENGGLYNSSDATLWFFHALDRYNQATGDRSLLQALLPKLHDIIQHHLRGTRFGIGVDPADGLLRQGAEGTQLTWMDAKVDGWVVTPRRGKAVEINALYYNALRLLERWSREEDQDAEADLMRDHARKAWSSFNQRFWYEQGGYLYDVLDGENGDDASLRPNQIFSISLAYPVLDRSRWDHVLEIVEAELLTPVGLRSLSRHHPDYRPRYDGDLRARDAAYHQGTVWAWLIGPFVDAWRKTHGDDPIRIRSLLAGFIPHLSEAGIGTISEVFDAEPPFTPRGCVAQAWSVAEVLRCLAMTARAARKPVPGEVGSIAA